MYNGWCFVSVYAYPHLSLLLRGFKEKSVDDSYSVRLNVLVSAKINTIFNTNTLKVTNTLQVHLCMLCLRTLTPEDVGSIDRW